MPLLTTYQAFIERVEELGFMALSHVLAGLPSLGSETLDNQWHTGIPETDPWQWKNRAAEEKRLAYGCILGGNKGFVAPRMYAVFYAACHPGMSMIERWEAGEVSQDVWKLWQLFEKRRLLNTSDVRREMGVRKGRGGNRGDACIQQLEREFYITVAGVRRRVAQSGQPYGWPASVYDRVLDWAPPEWLRVSPGLHRREAWEIILETGMEIGSGLDREALARFLGRPRIQA